MTTTERIEVTLTSRVLAEFQVEDAGGTSPDVLATSKSGTLLLRRDQGDMAALLDSRRCRL